MHSKHISLRFYRDNKNVCSITTYYGMYKTEVKLIVCDARGIIKENY